MALKPKYVNGDEIPQEQRSHYVERDGVFVLDIEGGYADRGRLSEFRKNNSALKRQIEELTKHFEGIDADDVRNLAAEKIRNRRNSVLQRQQWPT